MLTVLGELGCVRSDVKGGFLCCFLSTEARKPAGAAQQVKSPSPTSPPHPTPEGCSQWKEGTDSQKSPIPICVHHDTHVLASTYTHCVHM